MTETASSAVEIFLLDDGLGRGGCPEHACCRDSVGRFRRDAGRSRRFTSGAIPFTPSTLADLTAAAKQVGVYATAALDLDAYANTQELMAAARLVTTRRGRVTRQLNRARREGYVVEPIVFAHHAADIVAIHRSKPVRDRKYIEGPFYLANADGVAAAFPSAQASCPQHGHQFWGVFSSATAEAPRKLVAYAVLERLGNAMSYRMFMGHGDHLDCGIMYLLHYELVASLLTHRPAGLRYLIYDAYARRPFDPATHWKRLALFKPIYLVYGEDEGIALPADPPMPDFAEGLFVLKQTTTEPWSQALGLTEALGTSPAWLTALHRMWIVELARAPGLTTQVLRAGPNPSLAVLRPLASGLFPRESLDGMETVSVMLQRDGRGLDTLLPLRDLGLRRVNVMHTQEPELAALRAIYPPEWSYRLVLLGPQNIRDDADLGIVEAPPGQEAPFLIDLLKTASPRRRLLFSMSEAALLALDCSVPVPSEIARCLSTIAGRQINCHGVYIRHGAPEETYWLWIEEPSAHGT